MSRSPETIQQEFFTLQPSGWALPTDPTSMWAAWLWPIAVAWSAIELNFEAMLPEVDPRGAVNLLPDYERVLGPDPCGRNALPLTIPQRQALAYQRWTARGGQTIAFYIALAAALGVTATIREGFVSHAGAFRAGQRLGAQGNQFNWQVTLPTAIVVLFRAGVSRAGERLGSFQPSMVACAIQRFAPAHTTVVFSYTGNA